MSNEKPSILLLEDEPNLGQTLCEYLNARQFNCQLATSLNQARQLSRATPIDIYLLDIGLPDGSGLDFAMEIRLERPSSLILFLSAQNDPDIRLKGLEIGADDYITKPFALKELLLRIERMLKVYRLIAPEGQQFGKLKMNLASYQLIDANGHVINLGQKECAILSLLLAHPNQVLTRDQIIDHVWGEESYPSPRTVDNYIVKLRKWSDTDPNAPIHIVSIRGIGYKLTHSTY